MAANFQEILNKRADAVEKPKNLPPGKYMAAVKGFETGESTKNKTPYVEITFQVEGVIDVLPENQEAAALGFIKGPVEMRKSYYLTEKSEYRLVDFLEEDLGISRSNKSIADMLQVCIGQSCSIVLDFETSKDGKDFISIKRTLPAS